ncbi:prealbumin-like fold domain-containing protein, partial [Ligilactobacillus aviarius]|uniref:prealbumin-like fold domain-containing protein n=1 Tax=Ligilactobacillus aviarius TaxID=1606 RepID=UPI0016499977
MIQVRLTFNKGGYFGKDGNINWGINGSIPDANTGNIVITDTPSGPATKINQASWSIAIKSANGYTDKFSVGRAQKELRAKITFDDKGGFTCVIPADVLRNTVWHIQYNSQTIETPTNGDTFDNHAAVSYNNKTQTADKQISFKQNMSGDIVGFDTGKLTLQKQDGLTKVALPGAQFSLYKNGTALKTAVTDNTGKLVFTGLTDGNYTLKETKAPNGYQLPKDEYHFTISQGKLANSNLPKNYILKNYKTASSSSKISSSTKSSSIKSSSGKKSSSSKISSSSTKSSSVKSSSNKKSSSSKVSSSTK